MIIKILLYIFTLAASVLYLMQKNDKKKDKLFEFEGLDKSLFIDSIDITKQTGLEADEVLTSSVPNLDLK